MQLNLLPTEPVPDKLWARKAQYNDDLILIFSVKNPPNITVLREWLNKQNLSIVASADQDYTWVGVRVVGSPQAVSSALSVLPKVPSHGSRTPGVLLPW